MRLVRGVVRLLGWLLTPLVAWTASFLGAWVAMVILPGDWDAGVSFVAVTVAALLAALISMVLWLRLLRMQPSLRKALHLTTMGVPELPSASTSPPADQP